MCSDLRKDFSDNTEFNIIFTPRNKETMKTRSTSAYRKLHFDKIEGKFTTGPNPKTSPLKIAEKKKEETQIK